jgi:hypothetical protein
MGLNDTRTVMPMELYGKRLAVGYGALKRDGTRDLLKPFDTRGLAPAAGYTSTMEDLGKFASWQFRLLALRPHSHSFDDCLYIRKAKRPC